MTSEILISKILHFSCLSFIWNFYYYIKTFSQTLMMLLCFTFKTYMIYMDAQFEGHLDVFTTFTKTWYHTCTFDFFIASFSYAFFSASQVFKKIISPVKHRILCLHCDVKTNFQSPRNVKFALSEMISH